MTTLHHHHTFATLTKPISIEAEDCRPFFNFSPVIKKREREGEGKRKIKTLNKKAQKEYYQPQKKREKTRDCVQWN